MEETLQGELLLYQDEKGATQIEVRLENENVWLTQAQLVTLYQSSKANISEHIKHIFEEGELEEMAVVRKFRTTAADGKNYNTAYYNVTRAPHTLSNFKSLSKFFSYPIQNSEFKIQNDNQSLLFTL